MREEYASSTLVLIAHVVGTRKTPPTADGYFLDGDTYKVSPVRIFKGHAGKHIELFSENSSGRFPMQAKREYLLFVYSEHGRLVADNCGNSGLLSSSKKAIAEVSHLAHERHVDSK